MSEKSLDGRAALCMILFDLRGCLMGITGYSQLLLTNSADIPTETAEWLSKWGPIVGYWQSIEMKYREYCKFDMAIDAEWEKLITQLGGELSSVQEAFQEAQNLALSDNQPVRKLQEWLIHKVSFLSEIQQIILIEEYRKLLRR